DQMFASGSPVTPVHGIERPDPSGFIKMPFPNAFADAKPTEISRSPFETFTETEMSAMPASPEDAATTIEAPLVRNRGSLPNRVFASARRAGDRAVFLTREVVNDPKKRIIAAIAGAALLVVIVLLFVAGERG